MKDTAGVMEEASAWIISKCGTGSILGVKFVNMGQDNSSQLFVQPLRETLKAREAEVE